MPRCASCSAVLRRRPFTLIEVLGAIVLVVVLALLSFKFFSNLQNIWRHSLGRSNTHEDGRLALGLIARDLQAAVARANDRPGQDIRFHQPSPTQLWFVADCASTSTESGSPIEVGYRLQNNRLERAIVDQSSADWNLYGDRDDAHHQLGYQIVIDGVLDLQFLCYDKAMSAAPVTQTTSLPALVCVRISVMDARDFRRWQTLPTAQRPNFEKQNVRTFWKSIHPG